MAQSPEEQALIARFSKTYGKLTGSEAMLDIERQVCGCDYGCTSWTTRDETTDIIKMLGLGAGTAFLEIGSGAGWPGLYLAKISGADTTLIDLPFEGLLAAKRRAETDGQTETCHIAQADAAALPFKDGGFDAIYHSDVLCCLIEKQAVLGECRRVIGDGGKMVFSVILITPGLSDADYKLAAPGGPVFIETTVPYPTMLDRAGWNIIEHADQTAAYHDTFAKMFDLEKANAEELEKVHGRDETAQLFTRRQATLDALEKSFLRREFYSVVPAG
ncbi:MAG: class I SAM-dependent methyltransferase [Rhodospirillales bacterium]|nr:class I SAM-dependent methyltransferase [Rhodospirillales bacterium]